MKRNRLLIISALVLVLLLATLLTACNEKHEVLRWKTTKEPTCTSEGIERGSCVDCGEVIERSIAPVADNHVWGEWEVTIAPSFNREGKGELTRVCRENAEHKQTITLPKLTQNGAGYEEFEVYKEPTVVSEGQLSAVISSEYGDVSFTVAVPKKEFDPESVEDAVLLGSSNKELIRKGVGLIDDGYNPGGGHSYSDLSYEYGTDYTHYYYYGENMGVWVSLTESGEIYGVKKYTNSGVDDIVKFSATSFDFNGYHYTVARAGKDFYGAEGLLYNAYLWGKKNANHDYREGKVTSEVTDVNGNVVNPNGETIYWFSFGYYNVPQYFCRVNCKFMLTDSGAIKYVIMTVDSYADFEVSFNPNTNETTVKSKGNPNYNEVVEYKQELVADYPDEPKHEYTESAFKVTDFSVYYYNTDDKAYYPVTDEKDENTASFPTGSGKNGIQLSLRDVDSATGDFEYDPVSVYRLMDDGRKYLLTSSGTTSNPVWIDSSYFVRSKVAGYIRLLIVTESGCEKTITLYAKYSSPSVLYPEVYEYSDVGYSWKKSSKKTMTATVYEGQSLTMRSGVSDDKKDYVDASYVAKITSSPEGSTASVTPITDSDSVRFVADTAGTYVVEMRSVLMKTVVATVTITVNPAPSVTGLMTGEYTATMKKFTAKVAFEEKDGEILATVWKNDSYEVLKLTYNEEYKAIVSTHVDGASLGMAIEMNEAYKLVLASPTGFGSGKERAIMYVYEPEEE